MENETVISIADFSKYPSGRDDSDGSYNGSKYRITILKPAIEKAQETDGRVRVSLAGVMSFGSSFLEEAFGGLVRKEGFSKSQLKKLMSIDPGKPSFSRYERTIWNHIDNA